MDERSFDRLARLLGETSDRREGLKRALAAVLGGSAAVAALEERAGAKRSGKDRDRRRAGDADVDAGRKKRKRCKPACTAGFSCEKVGRKKRQCVCTSGVTCGERCCAAGERCADGVCVAAACDPACQNGYVCEGTTCACPSGVECGDACCATGQTCENGACTGRPDPDTCIAAGEPCKSVGRPCCDGRVCASGQGGTSDVACYAPKTGRCERTADCVYGMSCQNGRCAPPAPAGLGQPCGGPEQRLCSAPGAICQPYSGPGAPSGDYCTLPLRAVCTGDPQCGCYRCDWPAGTSDRRGRAAGGLTETTCCGAPGHACASDADCCQGAGCAGGVCAGAGCTVLPDGGGTHATIAAAIAAGETDITLGAGTYTEHDLPGPSGATLTLRPCGAGAVTIDAEGLGRIMQPIASGKTVTVQGIAVANGTATSGRGGAFLVEAGGRLAVEKVTVSNCSTVSGSGGGIANAGGEVSIADTTVSGCTAGGGGGGGGIYNTGATATMVIRGSTVSGCTASSGGGIGNASSLEVEDSEVSGNVALADGEGGGIWQGGPSLTLRRVRIHHNECGKRIRTHHGNEVVWTGGGGGLYVGIQGVSVTTLEDCELTDNIANWGGGIYAWDNSSNPRTELYVTGGRIANNQALAGTPGYGGAGGGVNTWAKIASFTDVEISGNVARGRQGRKKPRKVRAWGGGIYCDPGAQPFTRWKVVLAGSTRIVDNAADWQGGGIYTAGSTVETAAGSTVAISGNTAGQGGGGIYVRDGSTPAGTSTVTLGASTAVSGNRALGTAKSPGSGGGIHLYLGKAVLKDAATVSGNHAGNGGQTDRNGHGGGIRIGYGTLDLQNAAAGAISGNTAESATTGSYAGNGVAGLAQLAGQVLTPGGGITAVVAADNLPHRCGGEKLKGDCSLDT